MSENKGNKEEENLKLINMELWINCWMWGRKFDLRNEISNFKRWNYDERIIIMEMENNIEMEHKVNNINSNNKFNWK